MLEQLMMLQNRTAFLLSSCALLIINHCLLALPFLNLLMMIIGTYDHDTGDENE